MHRVRLVEGEFKGKDTVHFASDIGRADPPWAGTSIVVLLV